jgi:hypothetical protein
LARRPQSSMGYHGCQEPTDGAPSLHASQAMSCHRTIGSTLESGAARASAPICRSARSLLDLGVVLPDPEYFDHLMQSGHRRLGQIFYTPMCAGCRDCVPIRVSLADFRRSRSQRKLWRKVSAGYEVTVRPPVFEPSTSRRKSRSNIDTGVLAEKCARSSQRAALTDPGAGSGCFVISAGQY